MNAHAPASIIDDPHGEAVAQANRWRGKIINLFGKAEFRVSRALLADGKGKIPSLFSQKIDELKKLRSTDGLIGGPIEDLRSKLPVRNALVHGDGAVWLGRDGGWILVLRHIASAEVVHFSVRHDEAQPFHSDLQSIVDRLSSRLPS